MLRDISILAALLATTVLAAGCSGAPPAARASESLGEDGSALLLEGRFDPIWHSKIVPYCFVAPNWNDMPGAVQTTAGSPDALAQIWIARTGQFNDAIAATWGSENLVQFQIRDCGPGVVPVQFGGLPDPSAAGQAQIGPAAAGDFGLRISLTYLEGTDTLDFPFVAAHEMGHVLGFDHEQDQSTSTCNLGRDTTSKGIPLTAYDPNSIMNYCASRDHLLTDQDRAGFRAVYGTGAASLPPVDEAALQRVECDPLFAYVPTAKGSVDTGIAQTFQFRNGCVANTIQVFQVDASGHETHIADVLANTTQQLTGTASGKLRFRNGKSGRLLNEIILESTSRTVSIPKEVPIPL